MQYRDHVLETEELTAVARADACRVAILTLGDTVFQFETDIPWSQADTWPDGVRGAAECLVTAAGKTHTDEPYQQTGMLQRTDDEVWEAFAIFAGYSYDASAWSTTRILPMISLADEGDLVVRVDEDELERIQQALAPVRVVPLRRKRSLD